MYRLAVYGKGGVGKSAVSSNLSYLLSLRGHKVLHIGCDPKHDSTRLLTGGVPQRTFLDCMVEKEGSAVQEGENGISCVECGGAEPGIGCAGKGMTAMFSYMEDHTPEGTDIRICDVLGDIVCGGFSVPMRRNNVDGILIVVSEEFMALYAANNILRGIANLNGTPCVLGLILNSRDPQDRARAESFSAASGVPIIAEISRSPLFSRAEAAGRALCALFPDSEPARQLNALADAAERAMSGDLKGVKASPLSDRAMTQIAAGQPVTDTSGAGTRKTCGFDSYDSERRISYRGRFVMPACTSHGAFELLSGIGDAAVVMHGPRNCAFLDEYAWERETYWTSFSRGGPRACNIYSSGLDGLSSFAGDAEALRNAVMRAYADGFRWIFVVRTCASEILGSDLQSIIDDMHLEDAHVIVIPSDRKFLGSKWGCFGGACAGHRRHARHGRKHGIHIRRARGAGQGAGRPRPQEGGGVHRHRPHGGHPVGIGGAVPAAGGAPRALLEDRGSGEGAPGGAHGALHARHERAGRLGGGPLGDDREGGGRRGLPGRREKAL